MNDSRPNPEVDFEQPIALTEAGEEDCEIDSEIPDELLRLMENEGQGIMPHQEELELINLGTDEDRKEVKIGTTFSTNTRQELLVLLQ